MSSTEWKTLFPVVLSFTFLAVLVAVFKMKRGGAASKGAAAPGEFDRFEYIRKELLRRGKDIGSPPPTREPRPTKGKAATTTSTPATAKTKEGFADQNATLENIQAATNKPAPSVSTDEITRFFSRQMSGSYDTSLYKDNISSTRKIGVTPDPPAAPILKTALDYAYEEYEYNETIVDESPSETITPVEEAKINYGETITYFDANVTDIPWDADNKDLLAKDVVWGIVSPEASKSIFLKNYHRNLLGTPTNLVEDDETGDFLYYSPMLQVELNDPRAVEAVKVAELMVPMVGSMLIDQLFEPIQEGLEFAVDRLSGGLKVQGVYLSPSAISSRFGFKPQADTNVKLEGGVAKELREVGPDVKGKVGAVGAGKLLARLKERMALSAVRRLNIKKAASAAAKTLIRATIGIISGLSIVFSIVTFGASFTVAAAAATLSVIVELVFGILDMVVTMLYQIINPILDQLFNSLGTCDAGYQTFESLVGEGAYYFLNNFLPLGDIFGILDDYLCFNSSGTGSLKKPVRTQPYYDDSTLSIYYHNWSKNEIPGGAKRRKKVLPHNLSTEECIFDQCLGRCNKGSPNFKFDLTCWDGALIVDARSYHTLPKEVKYYPGYQPVDIGSLTFPWCNYASVAMMDRMAQFYHNKAWENTFYIDNSGTIEVSMITKFYAVVASSELTCDVACELVRYNFNAITGEGFKEFRKIDTFKPGEKADPMTYLRFYFVAGDAGPNGLFTVTGCTNADYTGTEAMNDSATALEQQLEYVPSVPKMFELSAKPNPDVNWRKLGTNLNEALARAGVGFLGAAAGMVGGVMLGGAGGILGGFGAQALNTAFEPVFNKLSNKPTDPPPSTNTVLVGDKTNGFFIYTETPDYVVNRGPIRELSMGVVPSINFCEKVVIPSSTCANKYVVNAMVNKYTAENPGKRIKEISQIEARGRDVCFYRFRETTMDYDNNIEGETTTEKEVLLQFEIDNKLTCRFKPRAFVTNFAEHKIRTIAKPGTPATGATVPSLSGNIPVALDGENLTYVTRKAVTAADGSKRYVPVLPRKPFKVPPAPPPSTTLGGGQCPRRKCEDHEQIAVLVRDFNEANGDRKILRVTKGWTPKTDRCDYEVEMQRVISGKKILGLETVSMRVAPAAAAGGPCLFTRISDGSAALNSGTYIMSTTPYLTSHVDISDGRDISGQFYRPYTSVFGRVQKFITDSVAPIFKIDVKKDMLAPAEAAQIAVEEAQKTIAINLPFKDCPNKKCSDQDILAAIMTGYNAAKAPKQISGGEGNTMKRIIKSAISGPDTCDVMFENLYELYDDIMYPPIDSIVDMKTYRFKMATTGQCTGYKLANQTTALYDISGESIVVEYPTASLAQPYTTAACTMNFLDITFLRSVKERLEQKYNGGGKVNIYRSVVATFPRGNNQCEYKIFKDMSYPDPQIYGLTVQETELETYVRVDIEFDAVGCAMTQIIDVTEFFPGDIWNEFNRTTSDYDYYIGDQKVVLPYLYSYDDTTPSSRVSTEVRLLS
jgi:hypothetical protein